jgi:hypothetical protein
VTSTSMKQTPALQIAAPKSSVTGIQATAKTALQSALLVNRHRTVFHAKRGTSSTIWICVFHVIRWLRDANHVSRRYGEGVRSAKMAFSCK